VTLLVSDFNEVYLPHLPDVPGMTSAAECRYLYWLASSQLGGIGRLVEVGSWLGRSTLHLAAGLSHSGHVKELHCFDGFRWAPRDSGRANLPLKTGDDFQKYFEANIGPFRHLVTAHRTQITDIAWSGEAIEILFLDAPKKLQEIVRCLEVFGSSLIAGKSMIVMQDYLYFPAYVLAVCMYALRDQLELVHVVLGGSTVAFLVTKPIDLRRSRPEELDIHRWSPQQIKACWDIILAPLPDKARERLELGRALHLYNCGAKQDAVRAVRELPLTTAQKNKIAILSKSHHYLSYPELFTAAGFPGTARQNLLSRAKGLRDWARRLRAPL
jgi:hypothetical protein